MPFFFKAVAVALRKYPSLNTSFDEASGEIVQKRYYHMGMAVATDAGLTVPVLRDVNHKSVFDLAREVVDLAGRAQTANWRRRTHGQQLQRSPTSALSVRCFPSRSSTCPTLPFWACIPSSSGPIVNEHDEHRRGPHDVPQPQSFDHRLVDGAEAARFCKEVIRLLENPDRLMLEGM